jgi:hypothetical protein
MLIIKLSVIMNLKKSMTFFFSQIPTNLMIGYKVCTWKKNVDWILFYYSKNQTSKHDNRKLKMSFSFFSMISL